MKIAFHDNQLGARGTTVALYDYARHNEEILGNASVILYPAAAPRTEAAVEARFRRRFRCLAYADRAEIEKVVRREGIDAVYWIRFGTREPLPGACRHLVHAVFAHDPHGDRYALVSEWLAGRHAATAPWVPHMIDLPPGGDDLRDRLGIPREAVVIGRYGGHDTFDVPFVHEVVARCARSRPDVYFLFADTDRFAEEHPQIVHLGVLVEPARKAAFIDTCDAMLHARQRGETFGLAVGEFSSRNRPVLTYGGSRERSHIDILGHRGIHYRDAEELAALLGDIRRVVRRRRDWNAYRAFTPARVMARFHEVFLAGLEPPPAAGGGRARAVARVNAAFDVYCINLARHPKRWRRSREEFGRQGLRVERFEGVDGSTLAFDDLVEAGLVREPFDPIERRKAGALGLIATSVALWRKVAEGAEGRWALVCEDDVRFHPGFLDLFEVYWREVPPDAEIVYFGFQYPWSCDPLDESVLSSVSTPVGRHVLRVTRPVNGTHAYAVTARSARRLLDERVPLQSAVDKFPPDRFNVYAFRRPPGTDRATVGDLYVDDQLWEGKHRVSQHGLISTRAEPSTIGHLPYHYLWFARHEREQRNFAEAFDYLMRIKRSPTMYDAATNDFALWHELTVTAFYVDRREGVHAFEELIERSGRAETREGLLRHEHELLDCVEYYRLPGLAASLRGAIARLKAPAG